MMDGPVLIVEDDEDDRLLFKEAFSSLQYLNELIFLPTDQKALDFLDRSDIIPFLIISGNNLPMMRDATLQSKIDVHTKLRNLGYPYIFIAHWLISNKAVESYRIPTQGFFNKDKSFVELVQTIAVIMEYWKRSDIPNNVQLTSIQNL